MKTQLLLDIVEVISSDNEDVDAELLVGIVDAFMRNGMTFDELEECYGFDDSLDTVIDEFQNAVDDEDEDDEEWADGGREDF
jgi:hypothetical protein